MLPSPDAYSQLEQRFVEWSLAQPAVAAVIVVGSRARREHPADEWSDLDLVVLTRVATPYLRDSTWLNIFGVVIAAAAQPFGQHDREWIALFASGCKLDAAILSIDVAATPTLQAMLDAFPYPNVLQRGVRVLIDKTGTSTTLRLPEIPAPHQPDQAEFTALIGRMWLDAISGAPNNCAMAS